MLKAGSGANIYACWVDIVNIRRASGVKLSNLSLHLCLIYLIALDRWRRFNHLLLFLGMWHLHLVSVLWTLLLSSPQACDMSTWSQLSGHYCSPLLSPGMWHLHLVSALWTLLLSTSLLACGISTWSQLSGHYCSPPLSRHVASPLGLSSLDITALHLSPGMWHVHLVSALWTLLLSTSLQACGMSIWSQLSGHYCSPPLSRHVACPLGLSSLDITALHLSPGMWHVHLVSALWTLLLSTSLQACGMSIWSRLSGHYCSPPLSRHVTCPLGLSSLDITALLLSPGM